MIAAKKILFKDHSSTELCDRLGHLGVNLRTARQLQCAIIKHGEEEIPAHLQGVSSNVLKLVAEAAVVPRLKMSKKQVSEIDHFAKYLFYGAGPDPFESVRIPLLHKEDDEKYVTCVSSQVGCPVGCAFCHTGRMGFRRNLEVWEMVDQVVQIQSNSAYPVRGVVFMGMGEPLLNLDHVIRAARILAEPSATAIDSKAITISTVGIIPGIERFISEKLPFKLIVSLISADPETRARLLPIEKSHPLPELISILREYHKATRKRVNIAWPMLSGINTRKSDIRQLADLTNGMPILLNIIDVNDPSGAFSSPKGPELDEFIEIVRAELKMPIVYRYSGGYDIDGACGMLAGR